MLNRIVAADRSCQCQCQTLSLATTSSKGYKLVFILALQESLKQKEHRDIANLRTTGVLVSGARLRIRERLAIDTMKKEKDHVWKEASQMKPRV